MQLLHSWTGPVPQRITARADLYFHPKTRISQVRPPVSPPFPIFFFFFLLPNKYFKVTHIGTETARRHGWEGVSHSAHSSAFLHWKHVVRAFILHYSKCNKALNSPKTLSGLKIIKNSRVWSHCQGSNQKKVTLKKRCLCDAFPASLWS